MSIRPRVVATLVERLRNWQREMERSCDAMRVLGPEMEEAAQGNAYVAEALEDAADTIAALSARAAELEAALEASISSEAKLMSDSVNHKAEQGEVMESVRRVLSGIAEHPRGDHDDRNAAAVAIRLIDAALSHKEEG